MLSEAAWKKQVSNCEAKAQFRSNAEAKKTLKWMKSKGILKKAKLRIYQCPVCGGYHFTGQIRDWTSS